MDSKGPETKLRAFFYVWAFPKQKELFPRKGKSSFALGLKTGH
jgi:hypothetical protein